MSAHPAVRGTWTILLGWLFCTGTVFAQGLDELPPEIDSEGVQTLTRGPVHEAFASPAVADPAPGMVIPKAPPADVQETAPEYQPEGDNVQWYPGYWAWDEDREDFIWISGIWRDPPPGRRWVPGYWAEVAGGHQWVAGFWIPEQVEEMEYLKPPPASLEQGPSVASPGDDYFYIPGSWTYVNNDYTWSAGYWAPYREDWVYVQSQWVWTPRGCIFVPGYYDWRVPRRGQIFAPVYFSSVVYRRPSYFYTPRCVINTSNLFVHLWVRDSYCHYYFGNYYGPNYANRHFTPWCNYNLRPRCYDPLLNYCNVHYRRQGINYVDRVQGWHKHYDRHEHERPAMTYREQVARLKQDHNYHNRPAFLADDLKNVVRAPDKHWKKQDLVQRDRNKSAVEQIKELHKIRFDQEKSQFVGKLPDRDLPGRGPDRDRPGRDGDDDKKGPNTKLPGRIPGAGNLAEDSKPGDRPGPDKIALPGKVKLPKPTVAVNKPAIKVPETPDKAVISRPGIDRPGRDRPSLNLPGNKPDDDKIGSDSSKLDRPGLGRPGMTRPGIDASTRPGVDAPQGDRPRPGSRPQVGGKPAIINPAENAIGNLPETNLGPAQTKDGPPARTRPGELKLPGRDPVPAKTPGLESKPGSAGNSAQDRLNAIRQQQQDALNKIRQRTGDVKPGTTTPKFEVPKRDLSPTTRPPLSSDRPTITPRTSGGGTSNPAVENRIKELQNRLNSSRGTTPRVDPSRSLTPNVEPRSLRPSVEPRSIQPRTVQPNIAPRSVRPPVERPQVQPRNSSPPQRPTAGNQGSGNGNSRGNRNREK
jgi:hypothetical protein